MSRIRKELTGKLEATKMVQKQTAKQRTKQSGIFPSSQGVEAISRVKGSREKQQTEVSNAVVNCKRSIGICSQGDSF